MKTSRSRTGSKADGQGAQIANVRRLALRQNEHKRLKVHRRLTVCGRPRRKRLTDEAPGFTDWFTRRCSEEREGGIARRRNRVFFARLGHKIMCVDYDCWVLTSWRFPCINGTVHCKQLKAVGTYWFVGRCNAFFGLWMNALCPM
ncbi:hypothetical protein Nepgr_012671 [Nepenthes gracilis]|uniref:Uncharacterized protein n=1 Tax=Nepenthes gracilis TaxID=150966 RepID=A0AAD3XNK2_NEPGR|nr:hypothetical protein Nepgr_012671 [Nepenthes gracilis]